MKKENYLKDLHIGSMIKEIARQRHVSAKTLADAFLIYEDNADKIYLLDDMDCENIVKISHLLEHNILDSISKKYLSHIPSPDYIISAESRFMKFDLENRKVMIYDPANNYDFLHDVDIGKYIRRVAERNRWTQQETAKQLRYSQGAVSNLYRSKSVRVKTLIRISDILKHNFIAEAYLSRMTIVSSLNLVDGCIIALHPLPQVFIKNPDDETFSVIFKQNTVDV